MSETPTWPLLAECDDAVLLVIDVQQRLLPHITDGEQVVRNIVRLARFAEIVGVPVLLTEQEKLGGTVLEIARELPDIAPVVKSDFGCFGCRGFREALDALGRRTLVLTGIETHICVAQTALQAARDCTVHVVADAVGARSPRDSEVALRRLERSGVTVTTTEMLMYELLRCAGTDEFRSVLKLVKDG